MHTEQWSTQLSLGKSFKGGWFMQLSAYNLFVPTGMPPLLIVVGFVKRLIMIMTEEI